MRNSDLKVLKRWEIVSLKGTLKTILNTEYVNKGSICPHLHVYMGYVFEYLTAHIRIILEEISVVKSFFNNSSIYR